jgi:hypothetical protein
MTSAERAMTLTDHVEAARAALVDALGALDRARSLASR